MSAPRGGLFSSTRRLFASGLQWAHVRLELLTTELQLGAALVFDAVVLAVLAGLGLGVGVVLTCVWLLLLVQEPYRLTALGLMAGGLLALGAGLLVVARNRLRQARRALDGSRGELARDIQSLMPAEPPVPPGAPPAARHE